MPDKTMTTNTPDNEFNTLAESGTPPARRRENVREGAQRALETAGATFDNRPLSAVGGALAIGAVAAVLIPTSAREREVIGPVAERVRERLDDAVQAARTAGTGELSASGLTFAAASNGIGGIVGSLAKAALAAGGAAATTVKAPRRSVETAPAPTVTPDESAANGDENAPVATR